MASRTVTGAQGGVAPSVLVVTADATLGGRLAELAAAAGVSYGRLPSLPPGWSRTLTSALLLVGADVDVAGERRDGLLVVCTADPDPLVWQRAVEAGAEQVIVLPEAEPWLLDRIVDAAAPAPTAPVVAVIGGRGGAGASTLAVALASVAARNQVRTLLVDADPLGGGLDLLLGAEQDDGLRWPDLAGARGRLQPGLLAGMLPAVGSLSVLSWVRAQGDPSLSDFWTDPVLPGTGVAGAQGTHLAGTQGADPFPDDAHFPGSPVGEGLLASPAWLAPRSGAGGRAGLDPPVAPDPPAPESFPAEWSSADPLPVNPVPVNPVPVNPVPVNPVPVNPVPAESLSAQSLPAGARPVRGPAPRDAWLRSQQVLRDDPDAAAMTAVLRAARGEFDLVVVDLSRRFTPADVAVLNACRTVVVVVPAEVRATAAAAGVCARLDSWVPDQRLVVRGPAPAGLPAQAVADALGLPLVAQLRSDPAVAAALDRGEPLPTRSRGALTTVCRRLLAEVLQP